MEYVAESSQSRRKRGPTKCKEIQSLPNDLTIPIKVNGLKQPVCPNSVILQSYLGTIAKNGDLFPIDYVDRRLVPKTLKERIYQLVEQKKTQSLVGPLQFFEATHMRKSGGIDDEASCILDKWKTLVHTASISPQQRRGEPVPQELLDRVLSAHGYWSQHQSKQHGKHHVEALRITDGQVESVAA